MPRLAHIALLVTSYDEALTFYIDKLGFRLVEDTPLTETKRWVTIRPPGAPANATTILLAQATSEEQEKAVGNQGGSRVFLFLETDDFQRDFESYSAAGVEWVGEARREDYGQVAVFKDLYGNKWDLIERA